MVKDKKITFNKLNHLNFKSTKFLIAAFLGLCFVGNLQSQTISIQSVDNVVKLIDSDSTLISEQIAIDTVYITDENYEFRMMGNLLVYRNQKTKEIKKIVWNKVDGEHYNNVSLYIHHGKAIKGNIQCYYKATDTDPDECKTNTIFYLKNKKIVKSKVLILSKCKDNIAWYLHTLSEMLRLSGIIFK